MSKKYKIVKPSDNGKVDFYGAVVGDIVVIDDRTSGNSVWLLGSEVFKEEGWTGLGTYCVADTFEDFIQHVEEVA